MRAALRLVPCRVAPARCPDVLRVAGVACPSPPSLSVPGNSARPLCRPGTVLPPTQASRRAFCVSMASPSRIQLYSLNTPNGRKIGIALEEMGLPYDPHVINFSKAEQKTPEFLAINPNGKIPAIIDPDGPGGKPLPVFESGAILLYLAEKSGKFLSPDPVHRWETLQWLFFQVGGVGPMFGQFGQFFKHLSDKCDHPFPLERYSNESKRLLGVLEKRLEGRDWLIDDGYSIADMATMPWVAILKDFFDAGDQLGLQDFPRVFAWVDRCKARPLTAKGMDVCSRG